MIISNITKKRIHDYINEGKREDGRGLLDYREIEIETGVSKNAEGSARVRIGKTEVIAGVKLDAAEPYTDSEDSGTLITTLELLPLSSPKYEPGPPKIEAIEIARIVDRGMRESGFIDFKKLCIKKGEKVWGIFLDIFTINDDGNVLDAANIASIAALKSAKMPKYNEEAGKAKYGEWEDKGLPLGKNIPLNFTFHKIGKSIFLDPTVDEEETSEARIAFAIADGKINAAQKGNDESLDLEETSYILDTLHKKWKETHQKIETLIEKALKDREN